MLPETLNSYVILSAVLFGLGFLGVLVRRNTLVIYMCLELMLVASTLALVAFSRYNGTMDGNVFVFFILTVADRKSTRLNSSHTEIYTLSLHDALPILPRADARGLDVGAGRVLALQRHDGRQRFRIFHSHCRRSEEHTSELQSHRDLHSFPTRRSSDLASS